MQNLILTPDVNFYGMLVLLVLSLGSFPIARHMHIRWFKKYFSFFGSNALIKFFMVLFGLFFLRFKDMFSNSLIKNFYGFFFGIVLGFLVIIMESYLIKKNNRKKILYHNHLKNETQLLRNTFISPTMSLTSNKNKAKGITSIRQNHIPFSENSDFKKFSLIAIIIVAIAEEFLFRGYIYSIGIFFHSKCLLISLLLSSTVLFAFSHMNLAWMEFIYKLPLSLLTILGFLATCTLTTPILTHVIFNIYVYFKMKE